MILSIDDAKVQPHKKFKGPVRNKHTYNVEKNFSK